MSLWTGCVLYKPELFKEFVAWQNPDKASSVKTTSEFILGGLLFCSEEKIRLDFRNAFASLCQHYTTDEHGALVYLLGLLANNFAMISDKPAR